MRESTITYKGTHMDNRPIGIFDSGLGGIAVLKVAKNILKNENFIYYGDNANAPYGIKSREEIFSLSKACVEFLLKKDVKAILIACNTATGVSVKRLREMYPIPFVSMEPAVKVGMKNTHGGKVLVMATPATLGQDKYQSLVSNLHAKDEVIELPCKGLAGLIETGVWEGAEMESYLKGKLGKIAKVPIDSCVLGCTHYAFAQKSIEKVLKSIGKDVVIVDGSAGTARHLLHILDEADMLASPGNHRTIQIFSSDNSKLELLNSALNS